RRSFIFAPGIRPDMFPKALASGADIVCIDLEDAIAPEHKAEAREKTLALFETPQADDGVERIVRVNCLRTRDGYADILAILDAATPPPAIMLPKVKSPDEVRGLDELFTEHDLPTRLHVIIETNAGLEAAHEIARSSGRIDAMFFGGVDMAAELRAGGNWESLFYARSALAHAAAGAELDVIDVPYLDLGDLDGMRTEAEAAANLGFTGKGAIHPKQIGILNETFGPSEEKVAHACRIIQAFEEGDTGLVVVDGKLLEKPV
ncbi:MAG: CoA ester lyase, partial [Alphaproteobacteria bacterium]|nr:CoA ester lyase [Alphaproteobacteria bacterium]